MSPENQSPSKTFAKLSWAFFGLIMLWNSRSFAQDFFYNTPGSENLFEIKVENRSEDSEPLWIVFYENDYLEELSYEIPARSTQVIDLEGLKQPNWTFSVVTKSSLVRPVWSPHSWQLRAHTRYQVDVKDQKAVSLQIFNLFLEKQKGVLRYTDTQGEVLQEKSILTAGFRKTIQQLETPPPGASLLTFESEQPLIITSDKKVNPLRDTRRPVPNQTKHFLVQNRNGGPSFVAPIEDPKLIAIARKEIQDPQGYIVFADLEINPQQPNRDFSSPTKNYWSWSIRKVTAMTQIGADWCHAYPEVIERMLTTFLTQQKVCFRGQRIIRELTPKEVESGQLQN
ncbi:MAG: hypothetical protein ACK5Y2_02865 [Bdellovibrionales bacterium]